MKKELSPPQTIAIVAIFLVVVVGFGWWWMNRSPGAPPETALGGTMNNAVPGQQSGGDPNANQGAAGAGPQMTKPNF